MGSTVTLGYYPQPPASPEARGGGAWHLTHSSAEEGLRRGGPEEVAAKGSETPQLISETEAGLPLEKGGPVS